MGSTSGPAPASRETEVTPGGASGLTSELTTAATSGGASGVTDAGWQEPGSTEPAGPGPAGPENDTESGAADSKAVARRRNWLRRAAPVADVVPIAPSVVAAGPELDLSSNDPLIGYLLSAASAGDITGLGLQSPALKALQEAGVVLVVPLISSGSLVGLLSLGPGGPGRGSSTDALPLLTPLAGSPPPAMRVGQL